MTITRRQSLKRRHMRIRQKVRGTAERPRLCIHKSLKHLYAQVIDDRSGSTVCAGTTNTKAIKAQGKAFSNKASATRLGSAIGKLAAEKGVKAVVFDRGGYPYHGVVQAFADAAREAGLKF